MYETELKICCQAARAAGLFIKKEFFKEQQKIAFKANSERVTKVDKGAEKIIFSYLRKYFPQYEMLSEESGLYKKNSSYEWVVDPLDGTTNFTIHHPMICTAIALLYKKQPVLGVIYAPLLDEMYYATKGQGAWRNGKKLISSAAQQIKTSVVTYCHGVGPANTKKAYALYKHFHNITRHCRHFGSTSLELAMLAAGYTQVHLVTGARLWDVAAGIIMVREAGGLVTDWKNKSWHKDSTTILAAANKKMQIFGRRELR